MLPRKVYDLTVGVSLSPLRTNAHVMSIQNLNKIEDYTFIVIYISGIHSRQTPEVKNSDVSPGLLSLKLLKT